MLGSDTIALTTRMKTYENPESQTGGRMSSSAQQPPSTPPSGSNGPLQIERPISDNVLRPPKATMRKAIFNPNARAARNYNIVEDLAQAPCAMSTLEVLQNCPSLRRTLLSALGAMDPASSNCIMFSMDHFKERMPHNLALQVHTTMQGMNIHRTLVDEGASTCVMSLSCWRAIGSPELNQSPMILKAFDGRNFKPYGILSSFAVELGGKTVSIDIEVIDELLDYNLLLGRSWFYAMTAVASSIFRMIQWASSDRKAYF